MIKKVSLILVSLILLLTGWHETKFNSSERDLLPQSIYFVSPSATSIPSDGSKSSQDSYVYEGSQEGGGQYFSIIDTDTKTFGDARFNFFLTIPSDWDAFDNSVNGDGYLIECKNKNIDMRVYGVYDVLPEEYYINSDNGNTVAEFVFDSGISGWQIHKENSCIKFLYRTDGRYITFYLNYEKDLKWFNENQEIIFSVAKTLKDGELI